MSKYFLIFLLIASCYASYGQPLRESSYEQKLIKAEELTKDGDYYNAYDMYQELYQESRDVFLVRPIAWLCYKLRDYERAESWYGRMVERPDRYSTELVDTLYYARTLKTIGRQAEAFDYYQEFIASTTNDSLSGLAELELIGMSQASKWKAPEKIFAEALSEDINSGLTEASPYLTKDGELYYSSFNKRSKIVIDKDAEDFHFKIYSTKKEGDKWKKPDKLNRKINREDYHTGNVAFSKDGRTMYFTRSRLYGDSLIYSKIFYSQFDGSDWGAPREVTAVNGDWIATHPSMGELFGDEVMYFVSDMDGGYGGYDIFYSTHKGGQEFSSPVNLGEIINTKGDDVTPFYVEGTLYYSSDGIPGVGNLDIFSSIWDGTQWSEPKNMGLEFNSTYDDFYFSWDPDEKSGFLVSNRPYLGKKSSKSETCCDDVFAIGQQKLDINALVKVFDENKKPLVGATVIVKEVVRGETEVSDSRTSEKGNTFNMPLKVDKQYVIVIERPGFHPDSFEVNTVGLIEDNTYDKTILLNPKPEEDDKTQIITINEPIRLNRIYYDYDDDRILPESEPDLLQLKSIMDQYPEIVIELSSHTDARGNDAYNENLSQRRAESARQWLINKGIAPTRIKAVGYGERQILNKCTNGVDCTEAEHRVNRRTEFKIIEGPTTIEVKKERILPSESGSLWKNDEDTYWVSLDDHSLDFLIDEKTHLTSAEEWPIGSSEFTTEIRLRRQFHDFGIMTPGEVKKHSFVIENTGNSVLLFERITAHKSITLTYPKYPILPGRQAIIQISFDSQDIHGEVERTINIVANTVQRVHTLRIRAFVQ